MKKYTIIAILALAIGLLTTQAFAWRGGCPGYGGQGYQQQQLTPEQEAAYEKFEAETKDLRSKLAADRTELQAMMRSENPDPKAARALAESMYETRDQIMAKAEELGIEGGRGGYGDCPGGACGNGGRGGRGGRGGNGDCPGGGCGGGRY